MVFTYCDSCGIEIIGDQKSVQNYDMGAYYGMAKGSWRATLCESCHDAIRDLATKAKREHEREVA